MITDKRITGYVNTKSYIMAQPAATRPALELLRHTIRKAVPEAEEVISYQMPAFRYHGMLMYFAAFKKHCSIFVRPVFLQAFRDELAAYKTTRSAVHFPYENPVPEKLVAKIAKHVARQNFTTEKTAQQ